ncbi:MAG: hypothetical protein M5U26_01345 [Planctomycetota bacterium]|nr:hypothetical protein [Planctomycetota bacterium]
MLMFAAGALVWANLKVDTSRSRRDIPGWLAEGEAYGWPKTVLWKTRIEVYPIYVSSTRLVEDSFFKPTVTEGRNIFGWNIPINALAALAILAAVALPLEYLARRRERQPTPRPEGPRSPQLDG